MSLRTIQQRRNKRRAIYVRKSLTRYAGPKCPEFDPGCFTCQCWAFYKIHQRADTITEIQGRLK